MKIHALGIVLLIAIVPSVAQAADWHLTYYFGKAPNSDPNVYHDAPPGYRAYDPGTLALQFESDQPYVLQTEVFPGGLSLAPDGTGTIFLANHHAYQAGDYKTHVIIRVLDDQNHTLPLVIADANVSTSVAGPRDVPEEGWTTIHFPLASTQLPPGTRMQLEIFLKSSTLVSQAGDVVDPRGLYEQTVVSATNTTMGVLRTGSGSAMDGPLAPACAASPPVCTFIKATVNETLPYQLNQTSEGIEHSGNGLRDPTPLAQFRLGNDRWPSRLELPLGWN
ncbi:MAG: hypothetical protein WDA16_02480 [Candidatus Thermoplasmatota archaeon]